jgi:hypothetical protein
VIGYDLDHNIFQILIYHNYNSIYKIYHGNHDIIHDNGRVISIRTKFKIRSIKNKNSKRLPFKLGQKNVNRV